MHQIAPRLWIGSDDDFAQLDQYGTDWSVLHAAKVPFHRDFLGYKGNAAPKEHEEYLVARRGNRMALNLIDALDPKYIGKPMIDAAMTFIDEQLAALKEPNAVLVNCNQGHSRAPTLGMLYLAPTLPEAFEDAEAAFRKTCPSYKPATGIREFAKTHWKTYRNRGATAATEKPETGDANLDKARELVNAFADDLKAEPDKAVSNLISSIRAALESAGGQR